MTGIHGCELINFLPVTHLRPHRSELYPGSFVISGKLDVMTRAMFVLTSGFVFHGFLFPWRGKVISTSPIQNIFCHLKEIQLNIFFFFCNEKKQSFAPNCIKALSKDSKSSVGGWT